MKKKGLLIFVLFLLSTVLFAASQDYDQIFSPLKTIEKILKYAGCSILILSLIAQGMIMFFADNIPEIAKKTISKVAVGGIFIGGASTIASFILPSDSTTSFLMNNISLYMSNFA